MPGMLPAAGGKTSVSQSPHPAADYLKCDATNRTNVSGAPPRAKRARLAQAPMVEVKARQGAGDGASGRAGGELRVGLRERQGAGLARDGDAPQLCSRRFRRHVRRASGARPPGRSRTDGGGVHPRRPHRRPARNPVPDAHRRPPPVAQRGGGRHPRRRRPAGADGRRRPQRRRAACRRRGLERCAGTLPAAGRAAPAGHVRRATGRPQRHVHEPPDCRPDRLHGRGVGGRPQLLRQCAAPRRSRMGVGGLHRDAPGRRTVQRRVPPDRPGRPHGVDPGRRRTRPRRHRHALAHPGVHDRHHRTPRGGAGAPHEPRSPAPADGGDQASGTARLADRPPQSRPLPQSDRAGHHRGEPHRDSVCRSDDRPRPVQGGQRHARPHERGPAPEGGGPAPARRSPARATRSPASAATSSGSCAGDRRRRRRRAAGREARGQPHPADDDRGAHPRGRGEHRHRPLPQPRNRRGHADPPRRRGGVCEQGAAPSRGL